MPAKHYFYDFVVDASHLDMFGHVNNATYFELFEQARWALLEENGYGAEKIRQTQVGPTILEIKVKFMKELFPGDKIRVETVILSYYKKISVMQQQMFRNGELCCIAEFVMALFDLKSRKLIQPTKEWIEAVGWAE